MTMSRMELSEPPAMAPSINVTCKITPDSPLWGKTYHDLKVEGAAIYVALAATDNQHLQEVFARRFYLVQVMPAAPFLLIVLYQTFSYQTFSLSLSTPHSGVRYRGSSSSCGTAAVVALRTRIRNPAAPIFCRPAVG